MVLCVSCGGFVSLCGLIYKTNSRKLQKRSSDTLYLLTVELQVLEFFFL